MNDSGGHRELLLHAMGIISDERLRPIAELHEIEKLGGALRRRLAIEAVHAAHKIEVFGTGETAEERQAFGNNADLPLHRDGILFKIDSQDSNPAFGGSQQAGEHFDCGGFAGAIRSEETKKLAGGDIHLNVVHCG